MYDLLIEIGQSFVKHGVSYTALIASLLALLKSSAVKRRLRRFFPWLFREDTERYIQNQHRIESKIDLLLQKEGIEWNASLNGTTGNPSNARTGFIASSAARSAARFVARCITYPIRKGSRSMSKFKSRKFWMAIISAILVVLNDGLDLGIDNNTVLAFAGIVMSFVFGEAYVDAKRVKKNDITQYSGDHGPAV
ncbi:hypothetical protein [Paenibacillus sp. GYB003]|uniref:hypothetical protein n=1 Tax=Paenibacillus sp. GYB003 TaxID=2994392 RepID=UPI002F9655C8